MTAVTHVLFLSGGERRNAIGGAEHHVLTLVKELAARGVDTELVVLLWNRDRRVQQELDAAAAAGVRVHVIERRNGGSGRISRVVRALECWHRLSKALRLRTHRIVHLHMELVMQVLAARLAGCFPPVITIHSDEPFYRAFFWRFWLRRLVRSGVHFVAITEHLRTYLCSIGVPHSHVTTIRYGVPVPARQAVRRSDLSVSDDAFVVGFVGRLTAARNVPLLIRAMALRPDMQCVLIGDGELRPSCEELAKSLGATNVRFAGARSGAATLMPLFDVLCLPSRWEGLGLVLVEAMLLGVPVVASRVGAIPEVLDNGRCGMLFDPDSPQALLEAVEAVRSDPARQAAMVKAAREHAATTYAVPRMVEETRALYAELERLGAGATWPSNAAA